MLLKTKVKEDLYIILNNILQWKLTLTNQFFLHSEICSHWGFHRIYIQLKQYFKVEILYSEFLIKRILFLGGIPNLNKVARINTGETVLEQFQLNLALEIESIHNINEAINLCKKKYDNGSVILLNLILKNEERNFMWFNQQISIIDQIGEQNYLMRHL